MTCRDDYNVQELDSESLRIATIEYTTVCRITRFQYCAAQLGSFGNDKTEVSLGTKTIPRRLAFECLERL